MKVWQSALVAALLMTMGTQVQAGVIIGGTRVVYDGGKKESSLSISNPDKVPYLVQSWIDAGEDSAVKAPFIITPPLFRLDDGQNNILRIVRAGGALPDDKESLYWLNIKSIPSAPKQDNTLQIAVKTRIKLIYRPRGLEGSLNDAAQKVTWQRNGNALQVSNPSPYYLTFFNVKVNGVAVKDATMVAPRSSARFTLPSGNSGGALTWQIINDFGGASKAFTANL
ncbi:fimbrial biogenesis chaperone [Serratia rhizosphaerae]|uniref:Molecular chaperone n=1 Tax=Serratia rhizosphaerae TaxID=2597702 RepID=A0ABX6GPQ2_9GAMM|nr:molecular chaperone [Serratia rhizosphaerae]MEB6336724.1 molecular chaperone [Serratia rhizosphaerae]QHA88222.1 molecular chaperone [Serratia rhizosphaerae]